MQQPFQALSLNVFEKADLLPIGFLFAEHIRFNELQAARSGEAYIFW